MCILLYYWANKMMMMMICISCRVFCCDVSGRLVLLLSINWLIDWVRVLPTILRTHPSRSVVAVSWWTLTARPETTRSSFGRTRLDADVLRRLAFALNDRSRSVALFVCVQLSRLGRATPQRAPVFPSRPPRLCKPVIRSGLRSPVDELAQFFIPKITESYT